MLVPGSPVGTAWLIGLAGGLVRQRIDLAKADLIVGTSAGAIVGAMLTGRRDLEALAVLPPPAIPDHVGRNRMNEVFAVFGDPDLDPDAARRQVGKIALDTEAGPEERHLTRMERLTTAREWPLTRFLITAVDAESGTPTVWHRDTGAPLIAAVASSTAAPGYYPPITINGRRYMNGGFGFGVGENIVRDQAIRLLIAPMVDAFPIQDGGTITITPDRAANQAFADGPFERSSWTPAYRACLHKAAEDAQWIGPCGRHNQQRRGVSHHVRGSPKHRVERVGKQPLVARFGGIPLIRNKDAKLIDRVPAPGPAPPKGTGRPAPQTAV